MSPRVVQSVGESNWGGKNEGLEPIVVFKSSIATVHPVSMKARQNHENSEYRS